VKFVSVKPYITATCDHRYCSLL